MAKVTMNDMVFEGTPEEIAVLFAEMEKRQAKDEPEVEEVTYNVGDYVKIIADECGHGFDIGQIVIVTELDYDGKSVYEAESLDGDDWCIDNEEIVLATEEEIAAAKAEIKANKTEEKWAEISRKPNNYKVGDIVRATTGYAGIKEGDIGEIVGDPSSQCPLVEANGERRFVFVELITPVEARFDR